MGLILIGENMSFVKMDNNLVNLLEETKTILNRHNLTLDDVTVIFNGKVLENDEKIAAELDKCYDNMWGFLTFKDIQLVVDDYTWFERASYDGKEEFILKAHPLLSDFKNCEFHQGSLL